MNFSKGINATAATLTKLRTGSSKCEFSGMCVTCQDGCQDCAKWVNLPFAPRRFSTRSPLGK